jgi:hypothetical protein
VYLLLLWLPTYFPACSLFQSEFVLSQEAICYINIFSTRKNILKSPIHFDQKVALFDLQFVLGSVSLTKIDAIV